MLSRIEPSTIAYALLPIRSGRAYLLFRDRLTMRLLVAGMALLLIGAAAAFADPRPDPDACQLLTDLDLEPLLFAGTGGTLDSWSDHPAPGLSTCRWEARPKGRSAIAAPRTLTLAFYHLADRQTAQRQLDRQPHGGGTSTSTAMPDGDDDSLVRSSGTVIAARHGADLAVIDARGAELSDPDQPEARYLLDALAIKAAGGTVKSPPWEPAGTKARWVPLAERASAPNPDIDWRPPANPAAITSPVAAALLSSVLLILRHGFLTLFLVIFGPLALRALLSRTTGEGRPRSSHVAWGLPVLAALAADVIFGPALANHLLHRYGTAAAATITGSYATSILYNHHNVVGYHVMLRGPDRRAVTTSFEDDDFNVYPPHKAVDYPARGDVFTVRYLSGYPTNFTILSDDGSPWAQSRRCRSLGDEAKQAAQRAVFSRAAQDHSAWQAAIRAAAAAGCRTDE